MTSTASLEDIYADPPEADRLLRGVGRLELVRTQELLDEALRPPTGGDLRRGRRDGLRRMVRRGPADGAAPSLDGAPGSVAGAAGSAARPANGLYAGIMPRWASALVGTNDFGAVARVLALGFVLEWPQPTESIRGGDDFARMNAEYPSSGPWRFEIRRLVASSTRAAARCR